MNVEAFSKRQILDLLAAAHRQDSAHWLMILVAYLHGLRVSEVIAIKADDIKDGFLTVQREKGSEKTVQPLLVSANPLLSERKSLIDFASRFAPYQTIFKCTRQTVYNYVRRYGKAAGIPQHLCHPHNLKHSCGTHMYEQTKDLSLVQKWLGHAVGSSTMVYLAKSQVEASRAAETSLCV